MNKYHAALAIALFALTACDDAGDTQVDEPVAATFKGPALEVEPVGRIEQLPAQYPSEWFFAHDLNFTNMLDGKLVLLDAAASTREYKGQLPAGQSASVGFSRARGEIYVAETIHERRVTGKRHDYFTIYDTATLKEKAVIELPPHRLQGMPYQGAFELTQNGRFALVANFTPAASVTVVDLDSRAVASEIEIPGCVLVFSTGPSGFSSLCSDGALMTTQLTDGGQAAGTSRSQPFIDIDNNAMFPQFGMVGGTRYFPTYRGDIQPVDFSSMQPRILPKWSLLSDAERKAGWRPGGWLLMAAHGKQLFVVMHEGGQEGSHKNPGSQIWVFDATTKKRVRTIELKTPAISIHVTSGRDPRLIAFNAEMGLDIYHAGTGKFSHTIGDLATETSFGFLGVD